LRAFADVRVKIPAAALALYGPGSDSVREDGVHPFGELHRSQALAVMAACDIFVRPTLADGDSVSVREALALGRTVVATEVGTRPPEVRLVPPGDAKALAAALLECAAGRPLPAAARSGVSSISQILALYGFSE